MKKLFPLMLLAIIAAACTGRHSGTGEAEYVTYRGWDSCVKLTDKLYEAWKFDKDYIYRSMGKLVTSGNKVMLLFDFASPEKWKRPEVKNGAK